jgi:outer membrane protein assembly factor BamB
VVDAEENIYFGCDDDNVYKLNADGELQWTYDCGGNVYSSPVLGRNNDLYIGSADGLHVLDTETGEELWSFGEDDNLSDGIKSSPILDHDGNVFFGGEDGGLYKVNATGLVWVLELRDSVGQAGPTLTEASGTRALTRLV